MECSLLIPPRCIIDNKTLWNGNVPTKWVNLIPIKVNVFCWKMYLDGLPTRYNMSKRGFMLKAITCPMCQDKVEEVDHLFFGCSFA